MNYFSHGENPLLHTWSLGVEEQFYLVWPPLFLLFALLAESRRADVTVDSDGRLAKGLLVGFVLVGALSLGAAVWLTRVAQPWAFFGTPTRLWEFALGGALAVTIDRRTSTTAMGLLLQVTGLVAIGFAVATYTGAMAYPGTAALLPALGAVALVTGGRAAPESVVSRLLAWRPFQWFGRLSYAWYLWHWPLVGLGAVLHPGLGPLGRLAWSAAALALAWVTFHTVERSARDGRLSRIPAERLPLAVLVASVTMALVAHGALVAAERRAAQPDQRRFAAAREDRMQHTCWANTVEDLARPCEVFGDPRSSTVVVLTGDSHAEHWLAAVDRLGRERGWKVVAMVKGGCPVASLPLIKSGRRAKQSVDCGGYREEVEKRIVAMHPAAVILSSWDHYMPVDGESPSEWQVTPDVWQGGLRRTYEEFSAARIPTVALRGTPRTWFDVPACLSRRAARLPFAGDCTYERSKALSPVATRAQDAAVRGLAVSLVDMNDQICAAPRCSVIRNGVVMFTDDNHLTASFTRSLAPVLGQRLDAAFSRLGARLP